MSTPSAGTSPVVNDKLPPSELEKREDYFGSRNNWNTSQKRSKMVAAVLAKLGVSNDEFKVLLRNAVVIWEHLSSTFTASSPNDSGDYTFAFKSVRDALTPAKAALKARFPQIFTQPCAGKQEQKFLCETAVEAIFVCVHYGTFGPRFKARIPGWSQKRPRAKPASGGATAAAKVNRSQGKKLKHSVDIDKQKTDLANDEHKTTEKADTTTALPKSSDHERKQPDVQADTVVEETQVMNDKPADDPKGDQAPTTPSQDEPRCGAEATSSQASATVSRVEGLFSNGAVVAKKPAEKVTAEEEKLSRSNKHHGQTVIDLRDDVLMKAKDIKQEEINSGTGTQRSGQALREASISNAKDAENTQTTTITNPPADQPLVIEVFSAATKSMLLRLDLKYLVDEDSSATKPILHKIEQQVKQWPFFTWPERLIFIYVSFENYLNIPIFSQQMLETAFDDWQRRADRGPDGRSCFRLYANDHDGPPPIITEI